MEHNEITVFQRSIETCADPAEIVRKVKLSFKRMPGKNGTCLFRQGDDSGTASSDKGGGMGRRSLLAHLVGR